MISIEYKYREYNNFIDYYGMIMFREYQRWLHRNKVESDENPFIKFRFYKRKKDFKFIESNKRVYEFTEIQAEKVTEKTSKHVGLGNKIINPDIKNQAAKRGKEIETDYINFDDVDKREGKSIITSERTYYNVLGYKDITFEQVIYDGGGDEIEMSTQTDTNMVSVQTQTGDEEVGDVIFLAKSNLKIPKTIDEISTEELQTILDEHKHLELKYSNDEIAKTLKDKVFLVDPRQKLSTQLAQFLIQLKDREPNDNEVLDEDEYLESMNVQKLLLKNIAPGLVSDDEDIDPGGLSEASFNSYDDEYE
jgi:Fe-S-cluster formation regulator IscX/YfhJ